LGPLVRHPKTARLEAGHYNDRPKSPLREGDCNNKSRDPKALALEYPACSKQRQKRKPEI
jgi:hypothetical protein